MFGIEGTVAGIEACDKGFETGHRGDDEGDVEGALSPDVEVG